MITQFEYDETATAPLIIDAIYKGTAGPIGFDSLSNLLGCGNRGGFRLVGNAKTGYKYVVLYSSLSDPDWPDSIDYYNGMVTYYGDNKNAGSDLHKTSMGGNRVLRDIFAALHQKEYDKIPPIFLFTKGEAGRDVVFKGLLIPGKEGIQNNEDLVAIWKIKEGQRFQNYRAIFTILDESMITRAWIKDLDDGNPRTDNAPREWVKWRAGKSPTILTAERTIEYRSKSEQLPASVIAQDILGMMHAYYIEDPYGFERCAAELVMLMDKNVADYDLTRRTMDGGRDAIGTYKIGLPDNSIKVEFAIEAKCYSINNSVGVRETSRLISRLRHRQFGVLVTTSYINKQAYQEITDDGHPVIILSGGDIVKILMNAGYSTKRQVQEWLEHLATNEQR